MQEDKSKIILFVDDSLDPIAELVAPVQFELDTRKLTDGEHTLKIVSKSPTGREGIRKIKFIVRNGPAISIEGISENSVVDGTVPLMINAYDKGNQKKFIIEGSETPQSVPNWLWILLIAFLGWAAFYLITNFSL
ncbi:cytochrome C [Fluviicola chungangensis]|uniref:Cytochrome C n=1 Tax=Fluviicola chungangensis TaxID=2597671 RepID=A0A556MGA9_9FLAO|nr:cytochrome C [Fluviicola chungangensis]TSJ38958.1 cytochrome C [Fluviicola chungangensis]